MIEILVDPLVVFSGIVFVFYAFSWILEKIASFLGFEDDGE